MRSTCLPVTNKFLRRSCCIARVLLTSPSPPRSPLLSSLLYGLRSSLLEETFVSLSESLRLVHSLQESNHKKFSIVVYERSVQSELIREHSSLGSSPNATKSFEEIVSSQQYSWDSMIRYCSSNGDFESMIHFFLKMVKQGFEVDEKTFSHILRACSSLSLLELGKALHSCIIRKGFQYVKFVCNSLVNMYSRCENSLSDAYRTFDEMLDRDPVTWNIMISGFVLHGNYKDALELFFLMGLGRERPNAITLAVVLPVYVQAGSLRTSLCLHGYAVKTSLVLETLVGNALVSMYANFGKCTTAYDLFDEILEKDVVSWNAIIAGLSKNEECAKALNLFQEMVFSGYHPNSATVTSILPVCGLLHEVWGRQIHCRILRSSLDLDVSVSNALLTFYSRISDMMKAEYVFRMIKKRDLVSWNAILAGYVINNQYLQALNAFHELTLSKLKPDYVTVITILPVCALLRNVAEGKKIHDYVLGRPEMQKDLSIRNALISFYGKCGEAEVAYELFWQTERRDAVSWNSILAAFGFIGRGDKVLELLKQMQTDGIKPDHVTILSILITHDSLVLKQGKELHGYCIRSYLVNELCVANALIDMYAKLEAITYASKLFENLSRKNVITANTMLGAYAVAGSQENAHVFFNQTLERDLTTWNLMIQACAKNDSFEQAVNLFAEMQNCGKKPDVMSLMCFLPVCARLASCHFVRQCHGFIVRSCFSDVRLDGALLDVYAKCGNIQASIQLFRKCPQPDLVMFTTMIDGLAMYGRSEEAVKVFNQMLKLDIKPDFVVMTVILSACSHGGLLDEGKKYYNSISDIYGIEPTMEHHACMVDLLARGGNLTEAYEFISSMPCDANANIWGTLLGASKIHHNVELGKIVGHYLFDFDAGNIGNYVLLSNIFAADRRWDCVEEVRKMMKRKDLKKPAGCSWIEVEQMVHIFIAGDVLHRERYCVYNVLEILDHQIRDPIMWSGFEIERRF